MIRRVWRFLPWLVPAAVAVVALSGPWLTGDSTEMIIGFPYSGPAEGTPLGTDALGRDVWSRLLAGGQTLLVVPVIAVGLTALLGIAMGMSAGYLGGPVDAVVSRLDTLLLVIPPVLVLLLILQGWGYSPVTLIAIVVLTGAPFVSRVARAATRQVRSAGYVEQAVALGESPASVLVREIVPAVARPVLADAGTRLAFAVGITAAAAFLGFGPDEPNWGAMVSQNMEGVALNPWGVLMPAVCLAVLAVAANRAVDHLAARISGGAQQEQVNQ